MARKQAKKKAAKSAVDPGVGEKASSPDTNSKGSQGDKDTKTQKGKASTMDPAEAIRQSFERRKKAAAAKRPRSYHLSTLLHLFAWCVCFYMLFIRRRTNKVFSLGGLAKHGPDADQAYVSYQCTVYDVTKAPDSYKFFAGGEIEAARKYIPVDPWDKEILALEGQRERERDT
eukprot:TRINITY_DN4500_c1_g1_i3.p1 TRINITY_DN4500_c1_g1~~TRINITY_DN4500_c1_g1_i3.p1  ORF type:complete len:173 (+),score=39.78 TRINITY_DN4500_c1_g1_i3:108-626(+)